MSEFVCIREVHQKVLELLPLLSTNQSVFNLELDTYRLLSPLGVGIHGLVVALRGEYGQAVGQCLIHPLRYLWLLTLFSWNLWIFLLRLYFDDALSKLNGFPGFLIFLLHVVNQRLLFIVDVIESSQMLAAASTSACLVKLYTVSHSRFIHWLCSKHLNKLFLSLWIHGGLAFLNFILLFPHLLTVIAPFLL